MERTRAELRNVQQEIAQHPLNAPEVVAARQIIDRYGSPSVKDLPEELVNELAEKGLPSVTEMGKLTARGVFSLARLHRRQKKLTDRLRRLER